ncbi:hypothetical protein BD410DRAFT_796396 [Rickenella mellea]|uniref:BTB domain-containing protein n=1 Tax=Rickenella mellea TaxID=50990 RepID=A0A4Y7PJP3_9AGAM|nr:hypothetical protein BD410DRAFT_796396 [Rickenella mellea]
MADQSNDGTDTPSSRNYSKSEFHPSYSDPEADIVLQSGDDVQFRVHSLIMKMASGFFRDMLGLPGNPDGEEPIVMKEKADIIVALLDIIHPNVALPKIRPELIWDVVATADRYDMPRAIETMSHIVAFNAGQLDPIMTYSLACRYGWEEVAKATSATTLDINLSTLDESQLSMMDGRSLFRLQNLHRTRRDKLFELMDIKVTRDSPCSHVVFYHCVRETKVEHVNQCCIDRAISPLWILMKQSVFKEMEAFPSGRPLYDDNFWHRREFGGLWSSGFGGCCSGHCFVFDRLNTKTEVLRVLNSENLPKTI